KITNGIIVGTMWAIILFILRLRQVQQPPLTKAQNLAF
ncbi:MAG: hypothetical protein RLZZ292_4031, partial [Bacteroidota bacterium]